MPLTRRQLLGGTVGLVGSAGLGCWPSGSDGPLYDVCVLGSGFAGIPLAERTQAAGLRTVVLEAAPWSQGGLVDLRSEFPYRSAGDVAYPVNRSRMIAVGGTSNHWTGLVNRLRPSDFEMRSRFGVEADWPLDYDALEPWYCAAEHVLAVRGNPPVAGAEPPRSCAYPETRRTPFTTPALSLAEGPTRFFPVAHSRRNDAPLRLVDAEVPAFAASRHGTLLDGHRVTRLVLGDASRVDHALALTPRGETRRIRARRFVLATGVFETPRLLLLSRSKWSPNGLGNQHGQVGRHFVAHPSYLWRFHSERVDDLFPGAQRAGGDRTYDFNDRLRESHLNAAHLQFNIHERSVVLTLQPEMHARPGSRVTLAATKVDATGEPVPEVSLGFDERDRGTLAAGEALVARAVAAFGVDFEGLERSRRWRMHPSGTCRMGFTPGDGVVDASQRVFGIDNLFVSGACVFPTAGTSNPTLTVVALALRLAEHLIASHPG